MALDLLELCYTSPAFTDETGITIEDTEAVHLKHLRAGAVLWLAKT
jgi:hypothetical protein